MRPNARIYQMLVTLPLMLLGCTTATLSPTPEPRPALSTRTTSGPLPAVRAQGTRWVLADGRPVALRGVNLGNWLLPEFWMLGYDEHATVNDLCTLHEVLDRRFGVATRERLMRLWRDNWITERDWDLMQEFGFNLVRVPFIWNLLEDEDHPGQLRSDAWHYLDWAVDQAERRGIYVVLDLHGAVGSQGREHHSGCAFQNLYWSRQDYQQRTSWLWAQIAQRYRDRNAVAAYDLLNEPWGSTPEQLNGVVTELISTIRAIDPNHVILLPDHPDGNIRAYGNPQQRGWNQVAFETHPYPGFFGWGKPGLDVHRDWLRCSDGKGVCEWIDRLQPLQTPLYIGEFQPWAQLEPELAGKVTRASFDRYNALGWAATAWAYKKISVSGGIDAPVNWGVVTNARGASMPLPDWEHAPLSELEAYLTRFGTVPYAPHEPVRRWLQRGMPAPDLDR